MALRFNPPPNWPAPPEGFEPPAGWQPDPAWGPAPEGWQIWVDDSAASSGSAASAAGAAAEADPAWAPTQAVSTAPTASLNTNAPVADPTGMSASAPFGDYAGQPAAVGASPYAANMDYAQSPTPFQNQGAAGGIQPPANGWQPTDTAAPAGPGNGSKPLTQQWWFWTGIAAVVVVAWSSAPCSCSRAIPAMATTRRTARQARSRRKIKEVPQSRRRKSRATTLHQSLLTIQQARVTDPDHLPLTRLIPHPSL